jgi:hypothetical protein
MTERLERIAYEEAVRPTTVEGVETSLFLTGPAEFLCDQVAKALAADPVWRAVFGEYVDAYKRMDYPLRALPALRIYNNEFAKNTESWFMEGDLTLDLIFPASVRRRELQQLPDSVTSAMVQQFRRPTFFLGLCGVVPGLNELGKSVHANKALAFEWGEDLVPLTQVSVNFRIDLRAWDDYLESDYRTKDQPFTRTLGDLQQIVTTIQALRDDDSVDLSIEE